MKFPKIIMAALTVSTLSLSSCYDLDRNPDYSLSSGTFYQTEDHCKQAMMGVYARLQQDYLYGTAFGFDCLGGICMGYDTFAYQTIQRGTTGITTGYYSNFWVQGYEGIARANDVLQNIDKAEISDQLKDQYRAEARFMRAVFYDFLLNFFGGVPIYDETTIVAEEFTQMLKPRATEAEVRSFIVADLTAAEASLPASWPASDYGRATSGAATALKGRVLLYDKQYQAASDCFAKVIGSGNYALYPNYADLFTPKADESSEMIFSIQNLGGVGQDYGMPFAFYMGTRSTFGSCWNNVMAATSYVDSFEWADGRPFDWNDAIPDYKANINKIWYSTVDAGKNHVATYTAYKDQILEVYAQRDPRLMASFILPYTHYAGWQKNADHDFEYILVSGMAINDNGDIVRVNGNYETYLWRKFVPEGNMNGNLNNRADTPINFPMIRFADVLLMQAECLNELGKQGDAVALINQVRARVGMPGINSGPSYLAANNKDEVFARIRHERAVELGAEGHNFFDMKRWHLLETLNGRQEKSITGGKVYYTRVVTDRDYYFPIPGGEIDKNPDLVQNPGW